MSSEFILQTKQLLSERKFIVLVGVIIMLTLAFCAMLLLSVQQRDILIASRYTYFGETHYYRDRWYYLYTFIVFALSVAMIHIALMVKLSALGRRTGVFVAGGAAIALLLIAFAYAHQVIVTAFL